MASTFAKKFRIFWFPFIASFLFYIIIVIFLSLLSFWVEPYVFPLLRKHFTYKTYQCKFYLIVPEEGWFGIVHLLKFYLRCIGLCFYRKERLGTLLSEITSHNNLRLITKETKGKRKKVIDVGSLSPRLSNISRATWEEPKASMSTSAASENDGKKPDPMQIRKSGPRLNNKTRMTTWNVRSLGSGKLRMITSEARRYGISVLGIAEHRWAGQGHFKHVDGETIIYSGGQKEVCMELRFTWTMKRRKHFWAITLLMNGSYLLG